MIQKDLRKAERIVLLAQPQGELYLYVDGEHYTVRSVLNISSKGISVKINNYVSDAAEVLVQYKHKDVNLRVNGTVVWKTPADEPPKAEITDRTYDIGINLMSPQLLFSLMQTKV